LENISCAKNEGIEILINLCNKHKMEENSRSNVKRHLFVTKAKENGMIVAVVEGFLYCVYGARFLQYYGCYIKRLVMQQ
jgi:hypothetical protein